jgi:hypothetical protein
MLPSTGPLSISAIRTELSQIGALNMGHSTARSLAAIASGAIKLSDFRGKYVSLPQISAYLFDNTTDYNSFVSSFTPPTMSTVFNTWARFSNNSYFASGVTPTGDAAAWQYNSTLGRVECTLNTSTYVGFVSPEKLSSYTLEVTLSSTNGDDDMIGVVAAFIRTATPTNIAVMVVRTNNGLVPNWGIQLLNGATVTTLVNGQSAVTNGVNTAANSGPGWAGSGVTRVKVQRNGNIISAVCSPFGSTVYDSSTLISVDLSSVAPSLVGAQSYGYCAYSQTASTYTDVSLAGGLVADTVYNAVTGETKKYSAGVWSVVTGTPIATALGYPRKVLNPSTGILFNISPTGVITRA